MASAAPEAVRQRFFGLSFVALNVGIGLGGLIGGSVADIHRAVTFELLYVLAGVAVVVGGLVILFSRSFRHPDPVDPDITVETDGYSVLLRDRVFRRFLLVGIVLMAGAYGQLEYGFTAFSADVAKVSTRVVGFAFAANCATIVVIQLAVLPRLEGRSRSRLLALAASVIGASWLVLAAGAIRPGGGFAIAAVAGCGIVFALGEVVMSPILPSLTNSLATDELRGRYNTMSSMTFGVTAVIGPITSAPLIGHGLWGVWLALVVASGLGAAFGATTLRSRLTAAQDGREPDLAPATSEP
jgi:hypothetical protein